MERAPHVKNLRKSRILVAPLDWGLGHATRCIPIIRELENRGAEVWLAGEGAVESLLKTEFPGLRFVHLDGYRARYGGTAAGLTWQMLLQSGRFLNRIKAEHSWLRKIVKEKSIDGVISDNRYGLYHESIPTVFITHQLQIKSPLGKWSERIIQQKNYRYINHFNECWIPDEEGKENLGGELSHPKKNPVIPLKYIGSLSRFKASQATVQKGHLLVLLSGPEPPRTLLENILTREIAHYAGTATVVRGLPGHDKLIPSTNRIRFYNHLPADQLHHEIMNAEFVIARSGYSTLMDMARMRKKCILIPTPGQPEQEYLAAYWQQKQFAIGLPQKNFNLQKALEQARSFSYKEPVLPPNNRLGEIIDHFLHSLSSR